MTGKMLPEDMQKLIDELDAAGKLGENPPPKEPAPSSKGTVFEPIEKYFEQNGMDEAPGGQETEPSSKGTVFEPVEKYFEQNGMDEAPGSKPAPGGNGDGSPPPTIQPGNAPAPPSEQSAPESKTPPDDPNDKDAPEQQLGQGVLANDDDEPVTNEDSKEPEPEPEPEPVFEEVEQPQPVDVDSMEGPEHQTPAWGKGDIDYGPGHEPPAEKPKGDMPPDFGSTTGPGVTDPSSEPQAPDTKINIPGWGKGDIDYGPEHEELPEIPKGDLPPDFGAPTGPGAIDTSPVHVPSGGGGGLPDFTPGEIGLGSGSGLGGDGMGKSGSSKESLKEMLDLIKDLSDPTKQ